MDYSALREGDEEVFSLVRKEERRQKEGLELIPSENYTSAAVLQALGSIFCDKYSEGYPKKRYYAGNKYVDHLEILAQERAKGLFGVPHANVQPYSGSPANFAVYLASCNPGDVISGLNLLDGGHLTHGWKVSATSLFYKSIPYHVKEDGRVDIDEVWRIAKEHKPKLIWTGATAYVYQYEFDKFAEIADSVGAYYAADIAHVAGLVVAGAHISPVPYAHIVTTTTHKTLRGPRGGMIMVTDRGVEKDPELPDKIDRAIFPSLQGGPHDHQTAAVAVALKEAATPEFKAYGARVVKNARRLADTLMKEGIELVGEGTENHLMLMDLVEAFGPGKGAFVQLALEAADITVNKNTIPQDPSSPFYPSGVRLGTPALTTRGMREEEMELVGQLVANITKEFAKTELPEKKRVSAMKDFKALLTTHPLVAEIKKQVNALSEKFPVPGINA